MRESTSTRGKLPRGEDALRTSRTRTSQMDQTYAGRGRGGAVRILGWEG
jgi:hypothetical protein